MVHRFGEFGSWTVGFVAWGPSYQGSIEFQEQVAETSCSVHDSEWKKKYRERDQDCKIPLKEIRGDLSTSDWAGEITQQLRALYLLLQRTQVQFSVLMFGSSGPSIIYTLAPGTAYALAFKGTYTHMSTHTPFKIIKKA